MSQALRLSRRQRERRNQAQAHPVAWQVREIVRVYGQVEASPSLWLQELQRRASPELHAALPANAAQLGQLFGALSEGLELLGVILTSHRTGDTGRFWRAETVAHREERRHLRAQQQEHEAAERARDRGEKAQLRAAKALARELRRRDARRAERAERKKR